MESLTKSNGITAATHLHEIRFLLVEFWQRKTVTLEEMSNVKKRSLERKEMFKDDHTYDDN